MHIILAVEELNAIHGGVERTVVNLANYLSGQEFRVTILSFEQPDSGVPVYPLSGSVERYYLGLISGRNNNSEITWRDKLKKILPAVITEIIRNILAMKRMLSVRRTEIPMLMAAFKELKPDIVISFKTHFHRYIVPAAYKSGTPVIASDHNPPDILYNHYVSSIDRLVIWNCLRSANAIRVLLESFKKGYPTSLADKCITIPNGIELPEEVANLEDEENGKNLIVNVGRLYFQKDQLTLIRAFALIADRYPEWYVEIYGDGNLKELLQDSIIKYNLEERVFLKGSEQNIMAVYLRSKIFALPSLFEGFGNVTLEAMACGLPVVAFDDVDANRQLVKNDVNGVLVSACDRVSSFAQGLERLMLDESLRIRLGENSRELAKQYEKNKIMAQWRELVEKLAVKSI